jgi:hypothetical protein
MVSTITIFVFATALAADTQPVAPQKWQNPTAWRNIKAGQTPEQVSRILGEPL